MRLTTVSRFAIIVSLAAAPAFAATPTSVGVVGMLEGTATAKNAAGAKHALKAGDTIYIDEEIVTGAASKLQIMLKDKSSIMLNANSNLKVREFAFNAETQDGKIAVDQVKGAFRFIGGALSKKNPVMIKTPVSSIGIRGGVNDTFIQQNGATDAVFIYGKQMDMTNADGNTVSTTSFGSGLAMQAPNDTPQPMSPQQIDQRLTTFANPKPVDSISNSSISTEQKPTEQTAASGDQKSDVEQAATGEQAAAADQKPDGTTSDNGDGNPGNTQAAAGDQPKSPDSNAGGQGEQPKAANSMADAASPKALKAATPPQNPSPPVALASPPTDTTGKASTDSSRKTTITKVVGDNTEALRNPLQYRDEMKAVLQNRQNGSSQTLTQYLSAQTQTQTQTQTQPQAESAFTGYTGGFSKFRYLGQNIYFSLNNKNNTDFGILTNTDTQSTSGNIKVNAIDYPRSEDVPEHPDYWRINFGPTVDAATTANNYTANYANSSSWHYDDGSYGQTASVTAGTAGQSNTGNISNQEAAKAAVAAIETGTMSAPCANCDYVKWGVWSLSADNNLIGTSQITSTATNLPFVAGKVTQNLESVIANNNLNGTYTYNGEVHGQTFNSADAANPIANAKGNFSMQLNTANRRISNFNGTLGAYTITSTGNAQIQTTGNAVTTSGLNINAQRTGFNLNNGSLNAALYGPQAQNIGGNFNANDGTGTPSNAINGVFLGSR